jgi:hypothetical protein
MKDKNDTPKPFPEYGCLGLLLMVVVTCFAAFSIGADNPYSAIGRFKAVGWDATQQKLFFQRPFQYSFHAVGEDGQFTCVRDTDMTVKPAPVLQQSNSIWTYEGVTYEGGITVSIIYEPLQLLGSSEPVPNSRIVLSREGERPFTINIDRFVLHGLRCGGSPIWQIVWPVVLIAGLIIGLMWIPRFPYRYRVFKYMVMLIFIGVVFFCFYMGHGISLMRATFGEFD